MSKLIDYGDYDALGLAELVYHGDIHPTELVEEAIGRIEDLNPELNAVVNKMYEIGRDTAKGDIPEGPFQGVPFLLKDLVSTYEGIPTSGGSRLLQNIVAKKDSELVRRFKDAGLIILGKTNTPELGLVPITEPELFGPTRNPWDLNLTPGGSSGGSAAAVAAHIVPMASAGDGGGSIRIPASCCGLFGLKPTRGRNPTGPHYGEIWQGAVCEHVVTRSVRDSAALLDATAGPDIGAPYYAPPSPVSFLEEVRQDPGKLRIGFTTDPFLADYVHPDCIAGMETTVKLLEDLGHDVEEAKPTINKAAFAQAFVTMLAGETRATIEAAERSLGRRAKSSDVELNTWALGLIGKSLSAADFAQALNYLKVSTRKVAHFFETYDILLTPTLALPPVENGTINNKENTPIAARQLSQLKRGNLLTRLGAVEQVASEVFNFIPYTPIFNVTGQPAMSVPLYWNEAGLPIGMQFVGRYGDEATLFRLAGELEQASPWFDDVPLLVEEYIEEVAPEGVTILPEKDDVDPEVDEDEAEFEEDSSEEQAEDIVEEDEGVEDEFDEDQDDPEK
ncbi:MAG: amidase [Chloroflexota bacterium]